MSLANIKKWHYSKYIALYTSNPYERFKKKVTKNFIKETSLTSLFSKTSWLLSGFIQSLDGLKTENFVFDDDFLQILFKTGSYNSNV